VIPPDDLTRFLEDSDGLGVFRQFVESELESCAVEFWMACRGLKKMVRDADSSVAEDGGEGRRALEERMHSLVRVINKKFVKQSRLPLSQDIKRVSFVSKLILYDTHV